VVKPENNDMSIFLKEMEHGKEEGRVHDKTDNSPGPSLKVKKNCNGIREGICNKKSSEYAREKDYRFFYGSRFHTSTGARAY
jgi:hypothetical protein